MHECEMQEWVISFKASIREPQLDLMIKQQEHTENRKQFLIISESHLWTTITHPACPRKLEEKWEHSLTPGGLQIYNKVGGGVN